MSGTSASISGYGGYSYGTETKIFGEPMLSDGTLARLGHSEGAGKMTTAERKTVVGSPDLESLTTLHIERAFLTVRQELKRFQSKSLGCGKDLQTHKHVVALLLGVYNFVRKHTTLSTTPGVAAGLEEKPWLLKLLMAKKEKAWQRRLSEDAISRGTVETVVKLAKQLSCNCCNFCLRARDITW